MADDDKFLAQMIEASKGTDGATSSTEATVEPKADDDTSEDSGEAPAKETAAGQQATPDPWESIKQKYTPDKIAELEKQATDTHNAKAMRREASFRNEEASKLKAEAEAARQDARAALDKANMITESLGAIADQNPELAAQMLATFKRAAGNSVVDPAAQTAVGGHQTNAGDKRLAALQEELESLKKSHAEFAFGLNTRELTALAWDAVERDPLLNRDALKVLKIPDRVVENAVKSVYEQDRKADPADRINAYDRKALQKAVMDAVKSEVADYAKLRSAIITDYRAEKKAKNASLPPSSKGQSASVRSGPATAAPPKPGASKTQRDAYWTEQMLAASRTVKRGEIA